jgi:hypothetical protein
LEGYLIHAPYLYDRVNIRRAGRINQAVPNKEVVIAGRYDVRLQKATQPSNQKAASDQPFAFLPARENNCDGNDIGKSISDKFVQGITSSRIVETEKECIGAGDRIPTHYPPKPLLPREGD